MCTMETEEVDYGLWDRTMMEVDLGLDEGFRNDLDMYSRGGPYYDSDPLLPLIGTTEDDVCQIINALSKSSRDRNLCLENCDVGSELELADLPRGGDQSLNEAALASFMIPGIVVKTEPYDGQTVWLGNDFGGDSDNSSTTSSAASRKSSAPIRGKPSALPPTPPCSDSSSGSPSPTTHGTRGGTASLSIATAISNALVTSEDGSLLLTEEEKRTLIAEGYPIPTRLPLTKAEERSLKRIRRKIKNKISAQESRRKKKEYIESLERKVKHLNEDNAELRRRLENSENANRSLAEQMSKYQALLKTKVQISPVRRTVSVQPEKSS